MPAATAAVDRLAGGATVVTATRRLARELTRAFDEHQAAAGRRAWESADALPWRAFVARVWRQLGARDAPGGALLLNEWQLAAAWEAVIADDIRANERDEALWNTHASARSAVDAWRVIHDEGIDLDACADAAQQSQHRDHLCWIRWAREYQKRCRARGWTDSHRLAWQLRARLAAGRNNGDGLRPGALPARIVFSGFDRLTRQQEALAEALRAAGVEVEVDAPAESAPAPGRLSSVICPDESAQWLAAAAWARAQLEDNPGVRIAVVAPNIGRAAPAIEAALRQVLRPRLSLEPDAPSAALPYHISLGAPLGRHPVARDALAALAAFGGRALPFDAVSCVLRSPFIAAAAGESDARCQLDALARRRLPHQIHFARLVRMLADGRVLDAAGCPRLTAALGDALAVVEQESPGARQPASAWARRFDDFLNCLGWPGEDLSSDEFQAARATRRELQNLATLDPATRPLRAADALAWLRRRAAEQAFQAEAHAAPVQVLGVLEAAGQHFDALWFGDLTADEWPPQQRPSPFIDLELQRNAGAPGAAAAESARAQTEATHRRLLASADEVVLSRPAFVDEDVAAETSVFFGAGDARADDAAAARDATPARILCAAAAALESVADARAPKLPTAQPGGGVAVLEDQAKCPFRAFALHRLRAREVEANEQGLDAGQRGALVHRALQLVWEAIGSSAKLKTLGEDQRREIIDAAVAQAARKYAAVSGCGAGFERVQARWLGDTVREWLEVEDGRGEFTVVGAEKEITAAVGGLELACKIDRIDQLPGGAAALIDYKTGAADGPGNWAGARPQSPQLPLYAIAQDGAGAVAFAQVKRGSCKFSGVADGGDVAPGVTEVAASRSLKDDFADWDELVAHWRRALPALAEEFAAGEARVAPHHRQVCARCNLHTLCRIDAESP